MTEGVRAGMDVNAPSGRRKSTGLIGQFKEKEMDVAHQMWKEAEGHQK